MAVISTGHPTLVDLAKMMDPTGRLAIVAEQLVKVNAILEDMPFYEGNLPTGHRATIRAALPTVSARMLNGRTKPTKGTYRQVTDVCAMIDAWSECDVKEAELSGDVNGFRMRNDAGHIQAMGIEFARLLFYGSVTNVLEFIGLSARYAALANSQVVNGGSDDTDNTSIWLCNWSDQTAHGIYPKGSKAGLDIDDKGVETSENSDGLLEVYRTHFTWDGGIHVRDDESQVRISNLEVSDLITAGLDSGDTSANLIKLMIDAIGKIPSRLENVGRWVFYCNKTVYTTLLHLAMKKTVSQLTIAQLREGVMIPTFFGIPVRRCDALVNTETRLT